MEVPAAEIEWGLAAPDLPGDRHPFLGVAVTVVVFEHRHVEHAVLTLIPARDHGEAEPPRADVMGGDDLLGGEDRVDQPDADGTEHRDAGRRREEARRHVSASKDVPPCPSHP
jgi:hypothetical protein